MLKGHGGRSLTCLSCVKWVKVSTPRSVPYRRNISSIYKPNANHHDRKSFLQYAERSGLSKRSTVYVGTLYEYTVLETLKRIGISSERTGGALDGGIDLRGTWALPSLVSGERMNVFVQCKATARKPGPNIVRELEGAFASLMSGHHLGSGVAAKQVTDGDDDTEAKDGADSRESEASATYLPFPSTMGLLVAPLEATKAVRDAMSRSQLALGFIKVDREGRLEQLLWNLAASNRGLQGIGVTTHFRATDHPRQQLVEEVAMTWKGSLWSPEGVNS